MRDRYRLDTVAKKSQFNPGSSSAAVVSRDDTALATAEAISLRAANECGVLQGTVTIERFTAFYAIGDLIRSLAGRNLGFRTDGNSGGAGRRSIPASSASSGISTGTIRRPR